MHVMGEGAIGTVHCVTRLARFRTSPIIKSAGLTSCNLEHWRWKQCQRLGSLSLSSCVAHAVEGDGCYIRTIGKSLRVGSQQRWQQVRVSVGNAQASTGRVGPLGVDELQTQLESLQQEAEGVQYRASGARARFMRLSEAAEQLRLRAALDVKAGRDDSAVRLLKEKQKVMQALEVSKKRAGVLEELHAKLNQAISLKETQLIAALSCARLDMSDVEIASSDDVRVVSPPGNTTESKLPGTDATRAMVGLEQSRELVEELEVATEGASTYDGNMLNEEVEQLSSQPEPDHKKADSAVEGFLEDGRTLECVELATETGALPDTEVTTDGRGYSLVAESGSLSGDDSDGGGKHERESSTTVVQEEETMEDLPVSRSQEEDPNFPEEDQQGVAASMLGGDVASQVIAYQERKSAPSIPNGSQEIKIAEVETELDEIKRGLNSILAFLDLEDENGGGDDLELQLTTLLKKRDVTQEMIIDLAKTLDTR